MGKGGVKGRAPKAEDVRSEQFINQGGELKIGGKAIVENANKSHYVLIGIEKRAKTSVGSLVAGGQNIAPASNLSSSGGTGPLRIVNNGTFAVLGK